MDQPIAIPCSECDFVAETGLLEMIAHILEVHPQYSREEAAHYAEVWEESAYEAEDLRNIERAEYYRRHGVDPEGDFDDHMPGK